MMYDLMITNGKVVTEEGVRDADIAVDGETIVAIAPHGKLDRKAKKVVDAAGLLVLPGGIDPHVHYNLEFGPVRSESQDHSIAAAFGGDTTIIDFAVREDGQSAHEAVEAKKAECAGRMAVDYGLHVILTGEISFEVIEEIDDLVSEGLPTIKTMMTYGWAVDDGARWGIMKAVAEAGGLSVVHAEDDAIANWLTKEFVRQGKTQGAYISETRPSLVEEAAVRRALLLAERSGSPLYILHIGAAAAVEALAEARMKGLPCYGETLTPYLSFTSDILWEEDGLHYNNFPTIKSAEDRDELWQAIADDRVQVVSSDHFLIKAAERDSKMGSTIDSDLLQCGQAGVEHRIPVLYSLGVANGRISLERFARLIATNPARIMGLYPKKGVIAVGSDADLVLFDNQKRWTVQVDDLHMNTDYSCWDGWELTGKVKTVILRGTILIEDEQVVGPTDSGNFLPRKISPDIAQKPLDPGLTKATKAPAQPVVSHSH